MSKNLTRTEQQIQAFVRWANDIISSRGLEIESFPEDLRNGVIMCHLAELLTKQKLKRFNSHPTLQAHEFDNLGVAFTLLKKSSLRLVNIGPQDIHSGNIKCILGLLWSCVQTFQLGALDVTSTENNQSSNTAPEQLLMQWVEIQLEREKVDTPKDFGTGWSDGNILAHLIHSISPESIDLSTITTSESTIDTVLWSAFQLGIPCLLTKEDILAGADSKAMTTWLSYFKQAFEDKFPRAKGQRANIEFLRNWINWFLSDSQIHHFKELLTIPPEAFKELLANVLHCNVNEIEGESTKDLIANSIEKYGVVIRDCTVDDIQNGNLFAISHYVTRLMKHCYRSLDNDDIVARVNRHAVCPIVDVPWEWSSGELLVKLAANLTPSKSVDSISNVHEALNVLETTLQLPQILDLNIMLEDLSIGTVSSYIKMIDYHWNLYLQNKLEQNLDEKYANAWVQWAEHELDIEIGNISSLMSMENLFPLIQRCLPDGVQLDKDYNDEDRKKEFLKYIIKEHRIDLKGHKIQELMNYEWTACDVLLQSLFAMRFGSHSEQEIIQFFHDRIALYPIYDLKNAWKSQKILIGLQHALCPDVIEMSAVKAMCFINKALNIPNMIPKANIVQITPRLRNQYLSLIVSQMMKQNIALKVTRDIKAMIDWAQWAVHHDGKHIQEKGVSFESRKQIQSELVDLIQSFQEHNTLRIEDEQVLFRHFESQTNCHCSNINDLCQWITAFTKEKLVLDGIVDLQKSWNEGLILQHLSGAINPIVMDDPDEMPSIGSYYKAILWAVDIPDVIQFTNCDDLSHNPIPNVLAFLSLIRRQLKYQEFHSKHLVPWLNTVGSAFLESQITTDLQVFEDTEMFRDLCVECLRCDIEGESFHDILIEVLEDRKLMELEDIDVVNKIMNGNIGARKAFLFKLFSKYNGVDKVDLDLKFNQFVDQHIARWNWTEIEGKCEGNYEVINELKAEKFLNQIHRTVTRPQLAVCDDVNSMESLKYIASALNIEHNLTATDINISNVGFKVFVAQIEQKLVDFQNEWLLNWINHILKTQHIPSVLNLEEIVSNKAVLSILNQMVFPNESQCSSDSQELQLIIMSIIDSADSTEIKVSGFEMAWKLFQHQYKIKISREELKAEYDQFVASHQGISWKNGDIIRFIAQEAIHQSQRKSIVRFDVMDHSLAISVALNALDVPVILESDRLHFYSDLCSQTICHLASTLLFNVDPNRFIVHWVNWLLKGHHSQNPLHKVIDAVHDILSVNVLNDILTMKHMVTETRYQPKLTVQEIIDQLCTLKTFDFESSSSSNLNPGQFGWSIFKYFYDINDEDFHIAILADYFQIDGITDLLGDDFQNGRTLMLYAEKIRKEQDDAMSINVMADPLESNLQYLMETLNVPLLFDLNEIEGNLKRVSFRTRIAFFTILRLMAIQRQNQDEMEQKSAECHIGQFVGYLPANKEWDGKRPIPALIVGYNKHSKLFDLKTLSPSIGKIGGETIRFVAESQLSKLEEYSVPIRIGDDDVFVDIEDGDGNDSDNVFNVQCVVESVDEEGLVMVEVVDSKTAIASGKKGERMKVSLNALSRDRKPFYINNEATKEALKDYLRKMLSDLDSVHLDAERIDIENAGPESLRCAALKQYEEDHFISPSMRTAALHEVMTEVAEKQRLDINGKYVDQLDEWMNNVRALMSGPKNVEVSFTVTTGRSHGGDKEQIDVIISGPIKSHSAKSKLTGDHHIDSYRLGLDDIEDRGNGKYKITFVGSGVGLYNIRVIMFGKESPLSPFQFMMKQDGGEWLRSDNRGKITAVKSDTMTAKSTDKISQEKRKKRVEKAMNFSQQKNKEMVKELMKLPESKKSILDEIEAIMTRFVEFEKQKVQIAEHLKTTKMKEIETKLQEEHDKVILSAFKRHINYPGLILTKYPNSRFAKPHTRRVKIGQIEDGPDMVNAVFMWTESKRCYVRDIKDIRAGISDSKPWKFCKVEPERCFEMNANGKKLCFHAATQYERDFVVKGFQLMLDAIFSVI